MRSGADADAAAGAGARLAPADVAFDGVVAPHAVPPARDDDARRARRERALAALAAAEAAASGQHGGPRTDRGVDRDCGADTGPAPVARRRGRRAEAEPGRSGETDRAARRRSRSSRRPTGAADPPAPVAAPPPDPAALDPEPDPHDVARQIVLRQLTMAPRSRAELERKLAQRGCADDVASAVLDRMEQVGLVDDEAYAGMLVRSRRAGRGLARRALRAELRTKGVAAEVAEDALGEVTDEDEIDEARRLVAKRLATMAGLPAQTQARRLGGMLARKGYSGDLAYRVIREAIREAPEHQRD